MTGFRLPAPSDAADLALVPTSGPIALVVYEYMGVVGSFDHKWGEFDHSMPTYRAKLLIRSSEATRLAVAFQGKRRANIKSAEPDQLLVFDLDTYVNADDVENTPIRVLFCGTVYEVVVKDLWSSDEGVIKTRNLLS
jgi:hypothetical protein